MNKLEQLKALIAEEQKSAEAWEAKRLNGNIMAVAIGSLRDSLLPLIEDTDK